MIVIVLEREGGVIGSNSIKTGEEATMVVLPPHLFKKAFALMRGSTKPLVLKVVSKEAVDIDRMSA